MTPRTRYTRPQLAAFMALARAHDLTAERAAAMDRHPAGKALHAAGVRTISSPGPIPRDLPPLTDADGTPAGRLPTTTLEDA
ncbi:hypothetical protein NJC10_00275 [Micrococcus sp. M4NT]|uniref:hypothetical protein n=1 Tax=Micrococcus sp. M4NT TaxID=2957501 RepID=UPI0029AE1D25|nr:hypothetical protein [Micrococcus sp. M4NT]MDX2340117.1 hypothetical protein [Micrococcus sp. M4NT]